jgi:hypothetical protein
MFNPPAPLMNAADLTDRTDALPATAPLPHPGARPRDSRAWVVQVWLSFLTALALCGVGLAWLPGADLDRAFMVMGYLFCLCSAFGVAKHTRDRAEALDAGTPMWSAVVWGGLAMAMALTAWGLWRMGVPPVWKAYLVVAWLFLISSAFTLAKTLRDGQAASRPAA